MASIQDILAYILQNYPHKSELSNARVTKMVYLCDWKHTLDYGNQITDINWYFDNYGPFVWEVFNTAKASENLFSINVTQNAYGNSKAELSIIDDNYVPVLSSLEKKTADSIISLTQSLSWKDFINLIYSTFPIVSSERYELLNLPHLAEEYKKSPLYNKPN